MSTFQISYYSICYLWDCDPFTFKENNYSTTTNSNSNWVPPSFSPTTISTAIYNFYCVLFIVMLLTILILIRPFIYYNVRIAISSLKEILKT